MLLYKQDMEYINFKYLIFGQQISQNTLPISVVLVL